jgi:hypothetical protein
MRLTIIRRKRKRRIGAHAPLCTASRIFYPISKNKGLRSLYFDFSTRLRHYAVHSTSGRPALKTNGGAPPDCWGNLWGIDAIQGRRGHSRRRIGNPLSNVKSGTSLSPEGGPAKSRLTFTTTS